MKLLKSIFSPRAQKNATNTENSLLTMDQMNTIWGGRPEAIQPTTEYWWVEENTAMPLQHA